MPSSNHLGLSRFSWLGGRRVVFGPLLESLAGDDVGAAVDLADLLPRALDVGQNLIDCLAPLVQVFRMVGPGPRVLQR